LPAIIAWDYGGSWQLKGGLEKLSEIQKLI